MGIIIDNVSMSIAEWRLISDTHHISVDVVDYVNDISVSGTYLYINNVLVSTTFSGIPYGYKITHSFDTITGPFDVMVHVENNNADVVEDTFSFLYGYNVVFDEIDFWAADTTFYVSMEAKNQALCPNVETASFNFTTGDYTGENLTAFINAVSFTDVNLPAVIYPQDKVFFYGGTYSITLIDVKDFSGNVMLPYTFSFTIRDDSV